MKKYIIIFGILALLITTFYLSIPIVLAGKEKENAIIGQIEKLLSAKITSKPEFAISSFPLPMITIKKLEFANDHKNIKIDHIEFNPSLDSMLSNHIKGNLSIYNLHKKIHLSKKIDTQKIPEFIEDNIYISNITGKFLFHNPKISLIIGDYEHLMQTKYAELSVGTGHNILELQNNNLSQKVEIAHADSGYKLSFKAGNDEISWNLLRNNTELGGELAIKLENFLEYLGNTKQKLPLIIQGTARIDEKGMSFENIMTEIGKSSGIGNLQIPFMDNEPIISAFGFDRLEQDDFMPILQILIGSNDYSINDFYKQIATSGHSIFNISANKLLLNNKEVSDFVLRAGGDDETFLINYLSGLFPGQTLISGVGLIGIDDKKLIIDGNIEIFSKNLYQFLAFTNPEFTQKYLVDKEYSFDFSGGFYFDGGNLKINRINGLLDGNKFAGDLMIEERHNFPFVRMNMQISEIDLQKFYKKQDNNAEYFNFPFGFDGRLLIQKAHYGEDKFSDINSLLSYDGKGFSFDDFTFNYGEHKYSGDFSIIKNNNRYEIYTDVAGDLFDFEWFGIEDSDELPDFGNWSGNPFDLSNFNGKDGQISASFKEFSFKNYDISDFEIDLKAQKDKATIKKLAGKLWDGSLLLDGNLSFGQFPAFAINLMMENIESAEFLPSHLGINGVSGKISINTNFESSGISMRSWLNALNGTIHMTAAKLFINGGDVSQISSGLGAIRSTADAVSLVNRSFNSGQTMLESFGGIIYIKAGKAKPHIKYAARGYNGVLSGEASLVDWTIDVVSQITFPPVLGIAEINPKIFLSVKGKINDYVLNIDSKELEDYVSAARSRRR
jgi:hypothetical protein